MLIYQLCFSGFTLDPLDMGDVSPPQTSAEDKVLIWGFMREGDIDIMGEDLNLTGYIINSKYCYCCYK